MKKLILQEEKAMKACIIIPCFNESMRLQSTKFIEHLKENPHHSILFVNDGSSDETLQLLKELVKNSSRIYILNLLENSGKAQAVRQGLLEAHKYDYTHLGFLDADLTISLGTAQEMIRQLHAKEKEFIYASRKTRISGNNNQTFFRRLLSYLFSKFSRLMIGLPVQDTQCGAKFFRAHLIPVLFKDAFVSKWIFDIEVFFRFKNYFENRVQDNLLEYPLYNWDDNTTSKIKFKDYLKVPLQLVKIAIIYRLSPPFSPSSEHYSKSKNYINKKAS